MLSTTALVTIGVSALLIGAGGAGILRLKSEPPKADKPATANDPYVLGYKLKDIDGKDQDLAQYKGKVILMVNVASKCGFTPQYAGLQALHERYAGRGLVILGFPCNQFLGQEPGSPEEIARFCSENYGVTFPLMEKVEVQPGPGQSPVYSWLQARTGEVPSWNFGKYLVGRDGLTVKFFGTRTSPDDAELVAAIEAALGG